MVTCLFKQSLKTLKLKELGNMSQNAICVCISWYKKICSFPLKNMLMPAGLEGHAIWFIFFASSLGKV